MDNNYGNLRTPLLRQWNMPSVGGSQKWITVGVLVTSYGCISIRNVSLQYFYLQTMEHSWLSQYSFRYKTVHNYNEILVQLNIFGSIKLLITSYLLFMHESAAGLKSNFQMAIALFGVIL